MKNKHSLKTINWIIFIIVLLTAIFTAKSTLGDLYNTPVPAFGEEAQSRPAFRWGTLHIIISAAILTLSVFLAIGWKRIFPFNVPVAIILTGLCYALSFLTFTIGWGGLQGIFGFFIALIIGVILIISYSIYFLVNNERT
ncbi:RND transporter [Salibacterium sp. K-3]